MFSHVRTEGIENFNLASEVKDHETRTTSNWPLNLYTDLKISIWPQMSFWPRRLNVIKRKQLQIDLLTCTQSTHCSLLFSHVRTDGKKNRVIEKLRSSFRFQIISYTSIQSHSWHDWEDYKSFRLTVPKFVNTFHLYLLRIFVPGLTKKIHSLCNVHIQLGPRSLHIFSCNAKNLIYSGNIVHVVGSRVTCLELKIVAKRICMIIEIYVFQDNHTIVKRTKRKTKNKKSNQKQEIEPKKSKLSLFPITISKINFS